MRTITQDGCRWQVDAELPEGFVPSLNGDWADRALYLWVPEPATGAALAFSDEAGWRPWRIAVRPDLLETGGRLRFTAGPPLAGQPDNHLPWVILTQTLDGREGVASLTYPVESLQGWHVPDLLPSYPGHGSPDPGLVLEMEAQWGRRRIEVHPVTLLGGVVVRFRTGESSQGRRFGLWSDRGRPRGWSELSDSCPLDRRHTYTDSRAQTMYPVITVGPTVALTAQSTAHTALLGSFRGLVAPAGDGRVSPDPPAEEEVGSVSVYGHRVGAALTRVFSAIYPHLVTPRLRSL
jgi:hypothetical protein